MKSWHDHDGGEDGVAILLSMPMREINLTLIKTIRTSIAFSHTQKTSVPAVFIGDGGKTVVGNMG
jgi:inosine-uridine nucleoside N-ribohydrolase